MLAQNFKSTADLGLSDDEYAALVTTLGMLERGELVHVRISDQPTFRHDASGFTGHFNMGEWQEGFHCGTVCCIGGTAELIGQVEFNICDNHALEELFYPTALTPRHLWDDITIEQAARALRSFLTTGHANWKDAVQ